MRFEELNQAIEAGDALDLSENDIDSLQGSNQKDSVSEKKEYKDKKIHWMERSITSVKSHQKS